MQNKHRCPFIHTEHIYSILRKKISFQKIATTGDTLNFIIFVTLNATSIVATEIIVVVIVRTLNVSNVNIYLMKTSNMHINEIHLTFTKLWILYEFMRIVMIDIIWICKSEMCKKKYHMSFLFKFPSRISFEASHSQM